MHINAELMQYMILVLMNTGFNNTFDEYRKNINNEL